MNFTEKISIIVPVYKVELYLEKCIRSIVEQTYDNLEIILVDDGSPDKCPEICDEWAKKDNRIKVIHKENGGLSDARNAGLAIATGQYIGFVDSDDWIHVEMYQTLYENMCSVESDISACAVQMVWLDENRIEMLTKVESCILSNEEAMNALLGEKELKQPVWYKLYKAELIRDIKFPVGKYHEDVFWSYQAIAKAYKVSVIDKIGYYYVQRDNSIMGQQYSIKRLDALEGKYQRLKYMEKYYPGLVEKAMIDFFFTCIYHGQNALKSLGEKECVNIFNYIGDILKASNALDYDYSKATYENKLWFFLAKKSLKLTCKIRNMLNIGF